MDTGRKGAALALALLAAGFVGPAGAVNVNPNGLGHVLLYPYYTVNKGQDTLLTMGNASPDSVVVRLRFLEGRNSRPALDLDVFLAPYDVWTGVVTKADGKEGAVLKSGDASCTAPAVPATGLSFGTTAFDGTGDAPADGGPSGAGRTQEGFVEVILGGALSGEADQATRAHNHTPAGPGQDPYLTCADARRTMFAGLHAAAGSLYGAGGIVSVGEGTYYAYAAEALTGRVDGPLMKPDDGSLEPSLARFSAATGAIANFLSETGAAVSLRYDEPVDAVSAVLSARTLLNDYLVSASVGASTDWIVTFPTKRYYTDPYVSGRSTARDPFPAVFHGPGMAPIDLTVENRDRDGNACASDYCLFDNPFHLDYAVNAIAFVEPDGVGHPSRVFGSLLVAYLYPFADAGVVQLHLPGGSQTIPPTGMYGIDLGPRNRGKVSVGGLPAIGFMAYNLINANAAPGRLANYGGTFRHKAATSACYGTSEFDFGCF